jgi:SAM-dependent methyltransferase
MNLNAYLDSIEPSVNRQVMPGDHMYSEQNPAPYFRVGRSALTCIAASLMLSRQAAPPRRILDFACGSGRVTRWLRAAYPDATIVGCDVREDSLQFLGDTLRVQTVTSQEDFATVSFDAPFDLVWCGSLITHLPADRSASFLKACGSWLSPDGVAVVTYHGPEVRRRLGNPGQKYVLPEAAQRMSAELNERDYSYTDYPGRKGIGFAVCSPAWVLGQLVSLDYALITLAAAAWDRHHDFFAFSRKRP